MSNESPINPVLLVNFRVEIQHTLATDQSEPDTPVFLLECTQSVIHTPTPEGRPQEQIVTMLAPRQRVEAMVRDLTRALEDNS